MTFKHTYKEMLEKAYTELPKIQAAASRFVLPEIESHVEGNKTTIKNLAKLATELRRPLEQVMKFMLRELATTGDARGADAIFTGKFRNDFLNEKVKKYAGEFVLCSKCGKPDTKLVKESGVTFKHCEACGTKTAVRTLK